MKLNKVLLLAAAVLVLSTAVAAPVNPKRAARVAQNFYASLSGVKGNATLTATPAEWQYKGIYLFAAAEGGFVLVAADFCAGGCRRCGAPHLRLFDFRYIRP